MKVLGGRAYFGHAIGVLLFDGRRYPILPGDVANASSYGLPVRMKVVEGLFDVPPPPKLWPNGEAPDGARRMRDAAIELEREGVRALVAACGFFVALQDYLAAAVKIPVFTSPLIIVPLLSRMLGNRKLGVLTASKSLLDDDFLEISGITKSMNVVVQGIEESTEFYATHMGGKRIEMDAGLLRDQVVGIAARFAKAHPDMAGMLIECSNLPTFSADIQHATGLPVFDYFTFVKFVEASIVQKPFDGFL